VKRNLIVSTIALCLAACGGTWKVVKQAPARELMQGDYVVSDCDFSKLSVAGIPEDQVLAKANDAVKQRWSLVKAGINTELGKAFADRAKGYNVHFSGQGLTIKPLIDFVDPGCPTGFCSSILRATVQILATDGSVLDEVQFESKHAGAADELSSEMRLRVDGRNVGWDLADYVNGRVSGKH
jgi:hypothetical protein